MTRSRPVLLTLKQVSNYISDSTNIHCVYGATSMTHVSVQNIYVWFMRTASLRIQDDNKDIYIVDKYQRKIKTVLLESPTINLTSRSYLKILPQDRSTVAQN